MVTHLYRHYPPISHICLFTVGNAFSHCVKYSSFPHKQLEPHSVYLEHLTTVSWDPNSNQPHWGNSLVVRSTCSSPIYSGYLSMLCRNLPFKDIDAIQEVLEAGIAKELDAARESYHPISLNWSCIMDHRRSVRHSNSLDPLFPLDVRINDHLCHGLRSAGFAMSSILMYPDYSKKTIGGPGFTDRCVVYLCYWWFLSFLVAFPYSNGMFWWYLIFSSRA